MDGFFECFQSLQLHLVKHWSYGGNSSGLCGSRSGVNNPDSIESLLQDKNCLEFVVTTGFKNLQNNTKLQPAFDITLTEPDALPVNYVDILKGLNIGITRLNSGFLPKIWNEEHDAMTKFFQKVKEKDVTSTHRYFNRAKMQSLQSIAAMEKELERLEKYIDSCAFLSICRSQLGITDECKQDGVALHNAFQEFKAVISQYNKIFLDCPSKELNKILEEMLNEVKEESPSYVDLIKNIWKIKFLTAKMTDEQSQENIEKYFFFNDSNTETQKEVTVTNQCTIL